MEEPASNGQLVRLIYRSHSKIVPENIGEELGNILRAARKNNAACGVTGALMYYNEWFAQALEGPHDAVEGIFGKIKGDRRHNTIEVAETTEVGSRAFARWAMASVGEHGDPDTPLIASPSGVVEGAAWKPTAEQEAVLKVLRDASRGYGRGA